MNTVTISSWNELQDELFEGAWNQDIRRFRPRYAFRGLSDAGYTLETTLQRLGGHYRSLDGGRSWKNMGLEDSGHISMIRIHPEDSNTVWVATQGPLWNSGGDRGLYKTTDGGENWERILHIDAPVIVHGDRHDFRAAVVQQFGIRLVHPGGTEKPERHHNVVEERCVRRRAQAAVEYGADAIGFVFYEPSPRHITAERAAAQRGNDDARRTCTGYHRPAPPTARARRSAT